MDTTEPIETIFEELGPKPQPSGPVTADGKARSSRNAEKHGIYAIAVLLGHEFAEAFAAIRDDYYRQFLPTSTAEKDLVDRMIAATWCLRRLTAPETAALDHTIDAQRAHIDAGYENLDPATRAHFAFDCLATANTTLVTDARFQAAQVRHYDRALRNLLTLRGPALRKDKICRNEPPRICAT